MKKILISLCFGSLLFASSYEDGIVAYQAKDYTNAIKLFKAAKVEYGNVKMQLLWAKSADALERKNSAIAAYERVVTLAPKNLEATIRLVELYKEDGQQEEARRIINSFDDRDLTPEQRSALAALLTTAYEKLEKFSGFISAKMGYDSNIALAPNEENINLFASHLSLSPAQKESLPTIKGTSYSQILASFSYLHDLKDVGGWFAKIDVTGMAQFNLKESFYNTKYFKLSAALGYKLSNITVTFPLSYDFTAYLERDLLQNYSFDPTLSLLLSSKYILNFTLTSNQKRYIPDSLSGYDAQSYGARGSLYYLFGGSYIVGKVTYSDSSTIHKDTALFPPKYVDYHTLLASIATNYRMRDGYVLNAEYMVNFKKYAEKTYLKDSNNIYTWGSDKRKDTYQKVSFGVSKDIYESTKVTAQYRYSDNTTNYNLLNYNKHNISIGLEYSF